MTQSLAKSWTVALRAPTAETLEVAVYDVIGDSFFGDGITAQDILAKLRAAPNAKVIQLRVNSVGGIVDDGKAMVNLLGSLAAGGVKVEAFVDGIAASIAAYLLTSASRVVMPANTFQMLHGVRASAFGTVDQIDVIAKMMRETNEQLAEGFAAASARRGKNKTKADYLAAFAAGDLYLIADEAIEWGLADEKIEAVVKMAACLADIASLEAAPESLKSAPYIARAVAQLEPSIEPVVEPPAASSEVVVEVIVTEPETTPAPEGSAVNQTPSTGEDHPMTAQNTSFPTTVAIALGLPAGSSESDIQASLGRFRDLEREVLAITGVGVFSEALGTIRGFKAKAESHDKMAGELANVKSERDKQNFETLIANGKTAGQLVPVTAKHYEEKFAVAVTSGRGEEFVNELRGFLAVAPRVLPQPARQVAPSASGSGPGLWNGKAYADLKPMEKDLLLREDPELFAHMRRAHQHSVA